MVQSSYAQRIITNNDEVIIRRKAVGMIKDLEQKYNYLLGADSEERKIVIDNMILPGSISTLFANDQLVIEDDFQTRENTSNEAPIKRVDIYFKELCSSYGKQDNGEFINEGKNITFSNIITSKLMAISSKDSLFLKVFFDVKYDGIDQRTNQKFKQPAKRVAEISAYKYKNSWVLSIYTIRFLKTVEEEFSQNVLTEKKSINQDNGSLKNEVKTPKKFPILKGTTAVIGAGAALYALKLNSDWDTKLNAVNLASKGTNYTNYSEAYDDASQFKSSETIRNICVGVAITSLAAEVIMAIKKPKAKKASISFKSSHFSTGIALSYKF